MKLSQVAQGRDNNFNLVRFIAAFAVLFSHSFALVAGTGAVEPLRTNLHMTFGTMAVDVFFITSGFLVTASLLTRQSVIEFAAARILRIYPALIVMVLLTIFVLGPYFTSLSIPAYFSDKQTLVYLFKNATLVSGVTYTLPHVFEQLPFREMVNVSLWTLPAEIGLYALLVLIWVGLRVTTNRVRYFRATIVALAIFSALVYFVSHFYFHSERNIFRLFFVFFMGAGIYILRAQVILSKKIFIAAIIALSLSAFDKEVFFVVYYIVIAYILFWFVYVPTGHIRHFNRIGDYSYGVYIYAFAVQQTILALMPDISVFEMFVFSSFATLFCAFLSWHLIEKQALSMKGHFIHKYRASWLSSKVA